MFLENHIIDIVLKTNPNLADFLLEGSQQIIERLADEFKLDKNTIEDVYTFDRETQKRDYGRIDGSLSTIHDVAKIIKYNQNLWLTIHFGFLWYVNGREENLLKDTNDLVGWDGGGTSRGIIYNSNTYNKSYSASHNTTLKSPVINTYKGFIIEIGFINNKEEDFINSSSSKYFQSLSYNYLEYNTLYKKDIMNLTINYLTATTDNFIYFYDSKFSLAPSIFQTGLIYINEEEYIVHSDLTLIRTKDSYLYSLNVNYGILNGEFNNFSLQDKNYSIILPAYLNSLNGENAYVDIIAPNLQKAQGMYTKYQEYVIDGTMYWCVAIDNTHNVLLLNEQITYEDWRENK